MFDWIKINLYLNRASESVVFNSGQKDGGESFLLNKSSNKNPYMLLHKALSAPSFGRFLKQLIGKIYIAPFTKIISSVTYLIKILLDGTT